jgi:diphthine synthase
MKLATTLAALSALCKKPVTPLLRGDLEEHSDKILDEARVKKIGVLVGGDCLSGTTHITLVIEAAKRGVRTRIFHGSSIFTAIAETGLSLYKFGRTVTLPLPEKGLVDTVSRAISENLETGLHTLVLLDLDTQASKFMTIKEALATLIEVKSITPDTLVAGVARLGSMGQTIKAGRAIEVVDYEFGDPPYAIVIPGKLHFIEEDALKALAGCPPELIRDREVKGELDRLIEKYMEGCKRVQGEMKLKEMPASIPGERVTELLDHADRYLRDAEFYATDKKGTALTSVAYAEGVLDALRLLGIVEFEW